MDDGARTGGVARGDPHAAAVRSPVNSIQVCPSGYRNVTGASVGDREDANPDLPGSIRLGRPGGVHPVGSKDPVEVVTDEIRGGKLSYVSIFWIELMKDLRAVLNGGVDAKIRRRTRALHIPKAGGL